MAWQRTALGLAGVSALLLHQTGGGIVPALPGIFGLVVAVAVLVLSELRYERIAAPGDTDPGPGADRLMLLLAGTVSLLAVMAVGLILVRG